MTYILRMGNVFRSISENSIEVHKELPVGTYLIKLDKMNNTYYLEPADNFKLPKKLYGNISNRVSRILQTFTSRELSTGVLLSGTKGAGKTLLSKALSVKAAEQNIPTLIVNQNYSGDEFNSFIQSITTPAIVLFDEFEKIYNWNDQSKILTLFDGVYPTKKLFVVTLNNTSELNPYFINRPGRMYYSFEYNTLEESAIREYCEDNLNDKDQIEALVRHSQLFSFFTFDMLSSIVEEMNRYDESFVEVTGWLNITPEVSDKEKYKAHYSLNGHKLPDFDLRKFQFQNVQFDLMNEFWDQLEKSEIPQKGRIDTYLTKLQEDDDDLYLTERDFVRFDAQAHIFVYGKKIGDDTVEIYVKRETKPTMAFNSFLNAI